MAIEHGNRFIDLTGKTSGRLTVIGLPNDYDSRHPKWLCLCSCGTKKLIAGSSLSGRSSQSCGCLRREGTAQRLTKHGHANKNKTSKTYSVWVGMMQRCENKNIKNYKDYGGRGINVCEKWHRFEGFLEDMGNSPDGLFLDRKDNNGNYELSNCRWATRQEQNSNKRTNVFITLSGISMTIADWGRKLQVSQITIARRMRSGCPTHIVLRPFSIRRGLKYQRNSRT